MGRFHPCGNPVRMWALATGLGVFSALAHADAVTDQAKQFMDRGQSQAAYDLLVPLEADRAGDETFDLLLGIAAIDIGRSTNAVLALERVLAINPNNARARAEIARAYFALGEVKAARQEFDTVKQQGIPAEVQKTIDKFLSAVERLEEAGQTTVRGFAEVSFGWDSNANGGANNSGYTTPLFGTGTLTAAGVKQSDGFKSAVVGVNLRKPIDPRLALVAGVSGNKRVNDDLDTVDTGSWDANVGLAYKEEKDSYSLTLQAGGYFVDNRRYRDTTGFSGQWQHSYDQRSQVSLFVQYADQRYPLGAQLFAGKKRDSERWVGGAGYAHALRDFKTVLYASAFAGLEDTRSQPTAALDYHLWGLRGGGQYQYSGDIALFVNASYENRRYQGPDSFFLVNRADDNFSLGIGASYVPAKNWKITPQYQRTDTRSNISINTSNREIFSISVRHDF